MCANDNGRLSREVLVDRPSILHRYFEGGFTLEKLVNKRVAGRFGASDQMYGLLST
jgi:hypothetical protein